MTLGREVLQWDACGGIWLESVEDWNKFSAALGCARLLARKALIPLILGRLLCSLCFDEVTSSLPYL